MSYDDYDSSHEMMMVKTPIEKCVPDYEAQAANIKKRLDVTRELETILFKFKHVVGVNSFKKISSIAELIGGVAIKKDDFTTHYEEILAQIEKMPKK